MNSVVGYEGRLADQLTIREGLGTKANLFFNLPVMEVANLCSLASLFSKNS